MNNWKNAAQAIATILENPKAKKGYSELKKYYISIGRIEYVNALEHLMEKRFSANNTSSSEKQRSDN